MEIFKKIPYWVKRPLIFGALAFVVTFIITLSVFVYSGSCTMIVDTHYCSPFEALVYPLNNAIAITVGGFAGICGLVIGIALSIMRRR